MSVEESVKALLKKDFDNVYLAGYQKGSGQGSIELYDGAIEINGEPSKTTIDYANEARQEGAVEGRRACLLEFWSDLQDNGAKTVYTSQFKGYTDNMFNPQFDLNVVDGRSMFLTCLVTNLEQKLIENNVKLNISNVELFGTSSNISGLYNWLKDSTITHLPALKINDALTSFGMTFNDAPKLKSIRALELKASYIEWKYDYDYSDFGTNDIKGCFTSSTFNGCVDLEEIHSIFTTEIIETTVERGTGDYGEYLKIRAPFGCLGTYINVSMCKKLSRETLLRISAALGDKTTLYDAMEDEGFSGESLYIWCECIFGEENLAKLTEEEITAITDKGWSVS